MIEQEQDRPLGRGWQIGGAVLLGLLVLVVVFALGVYVGRWGWAADPSSVAGPGRPPQGPARQPGQPPAGPWPQEQPALVGQVRSLSAEGLYLDTPEGPRFVQTTATTRYLRLEEGREVEVERDALEPGQRVAIFGRREPAGRTLTADRVLNLPHD